MEINIINPNDFKCYKTYILECEFIKSDNGYGNGYYLYIDGDIQENIDLRYSNYQPNNNFVVLMSWANSRWNGNNGSWILNSIHISNINFNE